MAARKVKMRAKLKVVQIVKQSETQETLRFRAVCKCDGYPADGTDENNTFAKFTPSADLKMEITNPDLIGKFKQDQDYYVDFTSA